ncbi:hypothetical protein Zmor_023874 [Zophobas morio]|uniref:Uncharacterized protein n=1 Tax=Zophobas morio TaxID=2755281 RepID=A0AA38M7H6_9CUCU|nr:hypothetical protein Zmor_023874 [Zophobas morio]
MNEDIKSYFFELLALQQELDPKMSDESFRSHFKKGLLPSLAETSYMFATPSMRKTEIKNLALKISEVKKLTLINNISTRQCIFNDSKVSVPKIHQPWRSEKRVNEKPNTQWTAQN